MTGASEVGRFGDRGGPTQVRLQWRVEELQMDRVRVQRSVQRSVDSAALVLPDESLSGSRLLSPRGAGPRAAHLFNNSHIYHFVVLFKATESHILLGWPSLNRIHHAAHMRVHSTWISCASALSSRRRS